MCLESIEVGKNLIILKLLKISIVREEKGEKRI